jgi:hypothetical protein
MTTVRAVGMSILVLLVAELACVPGPAATSERIVGSAQTPSIEPSSRISTSVPSPVSTELSPPLTTPYTVISPSPSPFPEQDLHIVSDEQGAITATVPRVWQQTQTIPWLDGRGQIIGTTLMASSDIEGFRKWQVEGVAISVSRRLPMGYVQLLDKEHATYLKLCNDTFETYWDFENALYRGKYVVFNNCANVNNSWLSVLSVVSIEHPQAYVARVLAYDLPPIFGEDFRDMAMQFSVHADYLP